MMNDRFKRISRYAVLLMIFIWMGSNVGFAQSGDIKVTIHGKALVTEIKPALLDGTIYVPLREIFKALGADVQWNEKTKTVVGRKGDKIVVLRVNSSEAVINEQKTQLIAPVKMIRGRAMVPLRQIARIFGMRVDWDAAKKTAKISSEKEFILKVMSERVAILDKFKQLKTYKDSRRKLELEKKVRKTILANKELCTSIEKDYGIRSDENIDVDAIFELTAVNYLQMGLTFDEYLELENLIKNAKRVSVEDGRAEIEIKKLGNEGITLTCNGTNLFNKLIIDFQYNTIIHQGSTYIYAGESIVGLVDQIMEPGYEQEMYKSYTWIRSQPKADTMITVMYFEKLQETVIIYSHFDYQLHESEIEKIFLKSHKLIYEPRKNILGQ